MSHSRRRVGLATVVLALAAVGLSVPAAYADDTTGTISGHFTRDGQPVTPGNVFAFSDDTGEAFFAPFDEQGGFTVADLEPGLYRVAFDYATTNLRQWAYQKLTFSDADLVEVIAGQVTTVDEAMLPTGTIAGTVTDAHGQPAPGVEVRASGETVEVVVRLHRAASLVTQIRDRASGAPVENACVSLVNPDTPRGLGNERSFCSDDTGKVVVGPTDAGSFKLFVRPTDGVHGMQWVGVGGGTGRFEEARVVRLKTGKPVALPAIEVDQAGSVAGVVTSASTGEPLPFGLVTLASFSPGVGPGFSADTNEEGRYVFDGLGPYEWPLLFSRFEYASQWTGGTADRRLATPIAVTAGQETAYDVAMTTGTTYTGTVLTTAGAPIKGGFVIAHNVATREITGSAWIDNGQYTLRLLGPQDVRIEVQGGAGEDWYNSWYVAAIDFKHATTVAVPASGGLTLDIVALPSTT